VSTSKLNVFEDFATTWIVYMLQNSLLRDTTHLYASSLIHAWHDPFRSDVSHSYGKWLILMRHDSSKDTNRRARDGMLRYIYAMAHSHVTWRIHTRHVPFILYIWRTPTGCLQLPVISRKIVTNYRAFWRKMTFKDKASYDSTPSCMWHLSVPRDVFPWHVTCSLHIWHFPVTCDLFHSYMTCSIHMCHDPFTCGMLHSRVTCSIHIWHVPFICHMYYSCVHVSFLCDMNNSYGMWHE